MSEERAADRTINPYLVLAAAALVPGSGHVLLRVPLRGLQFLFFMVILAWVSLRLAPADASFLLRHGGGVLIYGLSVLDAYKVARIRAETVRFRAAAATEDQASSRG